MAAQRGRKPGFTMSNEHRDKIQKSNILNALIEHAEGRREMSATQVSAGLGLLKKALPDLNSVQISGDDENPVNLIHRIELVSPKT
jgi:hypothetical protein